ncbi:hypothetical protein [Streptomyces sp. AA1529]|uniref:hypothetical protein n=1 Tax=Streptomyces sp. AA1529 TaxID=1203257 RepID=UPI003D708940
MKGQTGLEIRLDTGAQWSMPLTGEAFTHRNQTAPTQDSDATGRWIASDESGWDGEQLWGRGRYLVVASVAIDDAEAATFVDALREQAGIRQAPELKFARFKDRANRREALRLLWGPGGALHERCAVYVVDKEYAVAAKVIDMLLEERAHAMGIDLYAGGLARELARTLALKGQRTAQGENLSALMAAFVALASHRGRRRQQEAADVFFHELDQAWATTDHPGVKEILAALRGTRSQVDTLHLPEDEEPFPAMEMLVPSVAQIARLWAARLGPVSVLTDEQTALTDSALGTVHRLVRVAWGPTPSATVVAAPVRSLLRGSSADHPSIQLADLLAGATAAVAGRHAGAPSAAGDDLWPVVVPLLEESSLLPYDTPEGLAERA